VRERLEGSGERDGRVARQQEEPDALGAHGGARPT
jgi:hypothetical protein